MAQDYYEILGVKPDAELEEIKQSYRSLMRKNHPDAVPDAEKEEAHARTQLIMHAWGVLSNPTERDRYDRKRNPEPVQNKSEGRVEVDPWGPSVDARQRARERNFSGNRVGSVSGAQRAANPRMRALNQVFQAASLYFEGHMAEAVKICTQVMKSDPMNAEAPALLGDIYAEQGRKDVALLMYERAMRNQPGNLLYKQKYQAIKVGLTTAAAPPGAATTSSATQAPAATSQNTNQNPNVAANGQPKRSEDSNPASTTQQQSDNGAAAPAPAPPTPVASAPPSPAPAVANPGRPSIVGKLTGWVGKKRP